MENVAKQAVNNADPGLYNDDLAPTAVEGRTWGAMSFASLWVAMVVCVPAYLLAAGLIAAGMNWWQSIITVFLGNVIILIPMVLIGQMGTKYGVPFPVLLRTSFGTHGAKIPALARGLVACGWFGINTWVGGSAIYVILNTLTGDALVGSDLPVLGIDLAQTFCFLAFWALHLYFIRSGTESIRWLESLAAPVLIAMGLALLGWAYINAGGFGQMLSAPSQFIEGGAKEGQFWPTFFISLTAMVGFWATMALNIPDFTRFAKSQKDQTIGQLIGLPLPMAFLAFVSVAVTSATVTIYGEAIWDPVQLAGRMGGFGILIALGALIIATLTTNLAANVVAPAYGFSNLAPEKISFRMGGYITALIGVVIMPWRLVEDAGAYIFTWLVGYSALLGPIAGLLMMDYFIIRKTHLETDDLFSHAGIYGTNNGWNWNGIISFILGVLPNIPGFLHIAGGLESVPPIFDQIYTYAWFVGFFVAGISYFILNKINPVRVHVEEKMEELQA